MSFFASKPSRVALDWLLADPLSGSVLARAQRLQELQRDVDHWASEHHFRLMVASYDQQRIKVLTSHPAILARIRQQIPGLIAFLQHRGWQVNAIEPKVQAKAVQVLPVRYPKNAIFSAVARNEWRKLQGSLTNDDLKRATQKLCEHHGISSDPEGDLNR